MYIIDTRQRSDWQKKFGAEHATKSFVLNMQPTCISTFGLVWKY